MFKMMRPWGEIEWVGYQNFPGFKYPGIVVKFVTHGGYEIAKQWTRGNFAKWLFYV